MPPRRFKKSFVSSAFTHFIDIVPATLNTSYESKISKTEKGLLAYQRRPLIDRYEEALSVFLSFSNGKILNVSSRRGRREKDLRSLACIKADEQKLDDIRVVQDFPEAHRVVSSIPDSSLVLDMWSNRDGITCDPSKAESVKNWKNLNSRLSFPNSEGELCIAPDVGTPRRTDDFVSIVEELEKNYTHPMTWKLACCAVVFALNLETLSLWDESVIYMTPESQSLFDQKNLNMRQRRWLSYSSELRVLKTKILEAQSEASKDLKALVEWLRG
ncbi:hypothetical protein Tco_0357133 [Tanacetum coccineum]